MLNTPTLLATALLAAPSLVQAHYIFSQLIVNGAAVGSDYTYIRKNTNTYMPSFTADVVNSANSICNVGAQNAKSQTYDVKAGDKVGFKLSFNELIEHPGPAFVYMSKATGGDVSSYAGDGDWFKAWESGIVSGDGTGDTDWGTWQKDRIEFTIPADTPDGEYLVRPEHIAIHEAHVGKAQFYMECAQLRVSGGGSGSPSPLVQIPGLYKSNDVGIAWNKWTNNPVKYVMPGPAVWGGGGSSSASASTGSTGSSSASTGSTGSSSAATETESTETDATTGSTGSSTGAETSSGSTTGADASSGSSTGYETGAETSTGTDATTDASSGASTGAETSSGSSTGYETGAETSTGSDSTTDASTGTDSSASTGATTGGSTSGSTGASTGATAGSTGSTTGGSTGSATGSYTPTTSGSGSAAAAPAAPASGTQWGGQWGGKKGSGSSRWGQWNGRVKGRRTRGVPM